MRTQAGNLQSYRDAAGGTVLAKDMAFNKDTPIGQDLFYGAAGEPTDTALTPNKAIIGGSN